MAHSLRPSLLIAAVLGVASSVCAGEQITLVGTASIPGTAHDKSGLHGNLIDNTGKDTGMAADTFGSAGSAIDYTGRDNLFLMAADRGPSNGDVHMQNRVHTVRINVHPDDKTPVTVDIVATTLLTSPTGKPYNGSASALVGVMGYPEKETLRLDPEGMRLAKDPAGSFWISDEYGPYIYKFNSSGKKIDEFLLPSKYSIRISSALGDAELALNGTGRMSNRGMEGLAISPDGKTLIGLMQNALIQDHAMDNDLKRTSMFSRIITMNLADKTTHEFVYPFDSDKHGCNEILAVNDHEYLVIERDSKTGKEAKAKMIYKVYLTGATDISAPFAADGHSYDYTGTTADNGLPAKGPIAGVRTVTKAAFIDLLSPTFKLGGDDMPEKQEGLAWGPDFDNGDKMLVVTVDNDYLPTVPTWFYVFRISPGTLAAR